MLHRPGKELERLIPEYMEDLLFDDIPWLERMREEHDQFARVLEQQGVRVIYFENLLAEILTRKDTRNKILEEIMDLNRVIRPAERKAVRDFLSEKSAETLSEILISGLHKEEVSEKLEKKSLSCYLTHEYPYFINPLPNLYFTRDPGAVIGNRIAVNTMHSQARKTESLLLHHINELHPEFLENKAPALYNYNETDSIEGGDILVLSSTTAAIGCSQRTSTLAIERLARRILNSDCGFTEILVLKIPFKRKFMHLDTVLTMVDHDKFYIYPGIERDIKVFRITPDMGDIKIHPEADLLKALCRTLRIPAVKLIHSGGGDGITADREQWSDSTNTLAVAPGSVITYNRNTASNTTLRKNGINVIEIEGSELVRGRGGPRCMSMPLERDSI